MQQEKDPSRKMQIYQEYLAEVKKRNLEEQAAENDDEDNEKKILDAHHLLATDCCKEQPPLEDVDQEMSDNDSSKA